MNWTRRHTLVAGLGLVALTNAVALVGVAWNRSSEEAKLRLSERELQAPWYGSRENSGMSVNLIWRVLREPLAGGPYSEWYGAAGGSPDWLDEAKMRSLGFDTTVLPDPSRSRAHYEKQPPREVPLVLEFDGPAYQRTLELARERVAYEEAKLASSPADKNYQTRVKNARETLERETNRNSRLFVVDAGPDADALRAKYPDGSRYAVVLGRVRPVVVDAKTHRFGGFASRLAIESINVPFSFRGVFGRPARFDASSQSNPAPFEATVAFGSRFEPWIVAAARR